MTGKVYNYIKGDPFQKALDNIKDKIRGRKNAAL